jgi:hypothetical protein
MNRWHSEEPLAARRLQMDRREHERQMVRRGGEAVNPRFIPCQCEEGGPGRFRKRKLYSCSCHICRRETWERRRERRARRRELLREVYCETGAQELISMLREEKYRASQQRAQDALSPRPPVHAGEHLLLHDALFVPGGTGAFAYVQDVQTGAPQALLSARPREAARENEA